MVLGLLLGNAKAQTFVNIAQEQGISASAFGNYGNGVSLYDWNEDGFDDITLTAKNSNPRFFQNNSGVFTEVFFEGISSNWDSKSINWVDINNDGAPDLSMNSFQGKVQLFLNDGTFHFTDISVSSHIIQDLLWGYALSWADYNNDGLLDLYVSNYMDSLMSNARTNYLYKNNGDGTFEDVSVSTGTANGYNYTLQSVWFDYNNDSKVDLLVLNDRVVTRNYLYRNNGDGTFSEVGIASGLGVFIDAMSCSVGDYNNDGWFDVYITNTPSIGNMLFRNNGNGTFTNITSLFNLQMFQFSWGAVWFDSDNDTRQDLFVATIPYAPNQYPGYNSFFKNLNSSFEPQFSSGLTSNASSTFSCARGDFNGDGLFDILTHSYAPIGTQIWENTTITGNYLKLNLEGVISNRDAIGTRIELFSPGSRQFRYTFNGEQYISQNSQWQIFGLGASAIVDSLIIRWPSGFVDKYYQIPVNQNLFLLEGASVTNAISFSGPNSFCQGDSLLLDAGIWDSYLWSTGDTTRFLEVKQSGSYYVDVPNGLFTVRSDTVEVDVFPLPEHTNIVSNPSCFEFSDGTIQVITPNPELVNQITWIDGDTSFSRSLLAAGSYSFILTDTLGCQINDSLILSQPEKLELAATFSLDSCPGNLSGQLIATGGTPSYSYQWRFFHTPEPGPFLTLSTDTFFCFPVNQQVHIIYSVTDQLGCQVVDSYDQGIILSVIQPNTREISVYPNPASFEVSIQHNFPIEQIELRDLSGSLIKVYSTGNENTTTIQLADLPAGFYQLGFQLFGEKIWRPLIVK